ncbi:MAG: DUF5615 family PIN-like protein [Ignavibacteriaceae bacterium]
MKFKIDENLPVEISELLIKSGHDSKTVNEQQLKGTKDSVLINLCRQENRAMITMDTDFSDISAYPPEEYAGIIVLRLGSQAKNHVINVFQHTIPTINVEPLQQHLWIVEENMIRIRGKENKF